MRKGGVICIMAPALSARRANKVGSVARLGSVNQRKGKPVSPVRINMQRLSIVFLLSTIVPLALSFLAVKLFDLSIAVLLWVGLASIPLAAFTVSRAVLAELDRVIQIVAPEEPDIFAASESGAIDAAVIAPKRSA